MATKQQIAELADAMWQLLDDMGKDGVNVCLATKARARIAYEPFTTDLDRAAGAYTGMISLEHALEIERECT